MCVLQVVVCTRVINWGKKDKNPLEEVGDISLTPGALRELNLGSLPLLCGQPAHLRLLCVTAAVVEAVQAVKL